MLSMFSPLLSSKTSLAQISRAKDERMQRGISRFSVLRVMAIGAKRAVQPTIIRVLKRIASHHIANGNVCTAFESRGYADGEFRCGSAEGNNGKPDDDGRYMETFGNGCGTVCQAIGTQKNEEQSSDKKQYIHRYVNFEYKDSANRIQNFHVCMKSYVD